MEICLPYMLRVAVMIVAFYLIYSVLLRKMKSFFFNRIFLSGAILISFILPIFMFPINIITSAEIVTVLPSVPDIQPIQPGQPVQTIGFALSDIDWSRVVLVIFILGCVISSIRIIAGHFRVWKIVRKGSNQLILGHNVQIINENLPPFTYFRKPVIPSNILDSPHLQTILCHEQIHANELHCIDLYLAEILCILQWFNPAVYSFRITIRDNIEFLTDSRSAQQIDRHEYQLGIVAFATGTSIFTFPTISNQSQLKKRIVMMNRTDSNKPQWGKLLIITPIIAILTIISCGKMNILDPADEDRDATIALLNKMESGEKILSFGGEEKNAKNILYIIDGQKYSAESIDIKSMNTENIESMTVLSGKSATTHYGEEAKSGVIIITTKSSPATAIKLPDEEGVVVTNLKAIPSDAITIQSYGSYPRNSENNIVGLPVRISTAEEAGKSIGIVIKGDKSKVDKDSLFRVNSDKQPLYIVNGEKQHLLSIGSINQDSIKSITVLKNNEATIARYGEEAKNGVVIIELK